MKSYLIPILCTIVFVPYVHAQTTATGEISGTAEGPNGTPLTHAIVSIHRELPKPNEVSPQTQYKMTDQKGSFNFSGLLPGRYLLCASVDSRLELVASCEWAIEPQSVVLNAGEISKDNRIRLEQGRLITIRVGDPLRVLGRGLRLAAVAGSGQTHPVQVHLALRSTSSGLHHLRLMSSDRAGLDYGLVIPIGSRLSLLNLSPDVDLSVTGDRDELTRTSVNNINFDGTEKHRRVILEARPRSATMSVPAPRGGRDAQ